MAGPHGILLVDKARGRSSHDVVAAARRALSTRAVGHAGTLDPMATGLLVLLVGEATKLSSYLMAADKRYEAILHLGVETDSLDADGAVVTEQALPCPPSLSAVKAAAARLCGTQLQRAPIVSAIKRGGEPLYRKARRGEAVEAPAREVVLHDVEVQTVEDRDVRFRLHCGKGFYVRSFGRDLAAELGTIGHLTSLRRTQCGHHALAKAVPAETLQLARAGDGEACAAVRQALQPLESGLSGLRRLELSDAGLADARHGRAIPLSEVPPQQSEELPCGEPLALLDGEGWLVALARRERDRLKVVRGFNHAPVDPAVGT